MTSTTRWRGRISDEIHDRPFPRRPSLSPTPLPSSPFPVQHTWPSVLADADGYGTTGLGLLGTSLTQNSVHSIQPDHLYIDQNGGAHLGARSYSSNQSARDRRYSEARPKTKNSKTGKRKNHTRSGSTIDDLANAAIATSPKFTSTSPMHAYNTSPSVFHTVRPSTSHVNGYGLGGLSNDRPAKRIKSERLYATEWTQTDERPRTSHASDYQSPRPEEAELLLGLRYAWGQQGSPSVTTALPILDDVSKKVRPPLEPISESTEVVRQEVVPQYVINNLEQSNMESSQPVANGVLNHDIDEGTNDITIEKEVVEQEHINQTEPENMNETAHKEKLKDTENDRAEDMAAEHPTALEVDGNVMQLSEQVSSPVKAIQSAPPKKPKKIQPEVQAEVCARCLKLQREGSDEDTTTQWIGCEHCKKWSHAACVGFKDKQEARSVDKFFCQDCEGTHGTTTFVRKSSRARTAIDYAGLNQGVVKPSDESTMHHYIQPIKNGRIKYLPDDFARIRPELMTMEFWENMDGMKRPFVVPACWNPRFGCSEDDDSQRIATPKSTPNDYQKSECFDDNENEIPHDASSETGIPTSNDVYEEVVDTDQDYLDMVMPRNLTVRTVADLYGPEQPVPVIDVKSQETKGQFTLADWADYYEQPGEKPIRNVISLEVSNSRLGRLIRRPKVVQDIDLEDHVWDNETRSMSNKRPVQFYCLMSVADSYTDFHIDFGGSSVYYHILKGVKTFFFIPPEDKYLKKYEEWCNSDLQNDTWFGDLCGGNVTRVDLHEGDTAFIPAGWIHSVWTPEDSLVIGGNFLTRLDYELQLKVANIEKTTRVPLKFRYPFFQKVMWYSLLKYLEDDPVPEEVLRDFHEDEEYRFLRANPIYIEDNNSTNTAEPGEAGYNSRIYPKSELKGLPALRDYLYRTARIYADLSVPDINKRQIDAVKASIPKGHGDPMQLIKTFAVWCAWKIGNEQVPEWVHTDFGGLLPEIKEREKQRKAEIFRVPPERVSARRAQPSQSTLSNPDTVSPLAKSVQTPDSDDSSKKRNGSRPSGTRVACDACRKRRIKCRHKDGDVSPMSTSPAAIRPRTYSNISVDIPKLTSASPVMNGYDPPLVTNNSGLLDFSSTDLAQAALASLHSHSSDSAPVASASTPVSSSKKGRSKACEECRKSKRRCVHDEFGRVDPAKAAEPAKPRGSANAKRAARLSDDSMIKKIKPELDVDPALTVPTRHEISDAMIDPALMSHGVSANLFEQQPNAQFQTPPGFATTYTELDDSRITGDEANFFLNAELGSALRSSPDHPTQQIPLEEGPVGPELPVQVANLRQSPDHDISYSPITLDGNLLETTDKMDVVMTDAEEQPQDSRHPSRPPQVDQHAVEDLHSSSGAGPKSVQENRRGSSEGSGHTRPSTVKSRRSSSNTSGTTHQASAAAIKHQVSQEISGRPVSRGSAVDSEVDADERLARELQAAENGLRRRPSVRA